MTDIDTSGTHLSQLFDPHYPLRTTPCELIVPLVILRILARASKSVVNQDTLDPRRLHEHLAECIVVYRVSSLLDRFPCELASQSENLAQLRRRSKASKGVNGVLRKS